MVQDGFRPHDQFRVPATGRFLDVVRRVWRSLAGNILAISCGHGKMTLWKENLQGELYDELGVGRDLQGTTGGLGMAGGRRKGRLHRRVWRCFLSRLLLWCVSLERSIWTVSIRSLKVGH